MRLFQLLELSVHVSNLNFAFPNFVVDIYISTIFLVLRTFAMITKGEEIYM